MNNMNEVIKNIEFKKDCSCDENYNLNEEIALLEDEIYKMYIDDIKDNKRINKIENRRKEPIKKFEMIKRDN